MPPSGFFSPRTIIWLATVSLTFLTLILLSYVLNINVFPIFFFYSGPTLAPLCTVVTEVLCALGEDTQSMLSVTLTFQPAFPSPVVLSGNTGGSIWLPARNQTSLVNLCSSCCLLITRSSPSTISWCWVSGTQRLQHQWFCWRGGALPSPGPSFVDTNKGMS